MQPRIYTYKITFDDAPYWYWGVHKEKVFGEPYFGSPVVNKWVWDWFEPEITILQTFPFSDEGWREAQAVEQRLILPDLNNPLCLNELCGPISSLRHLSIAGQIGGSKSGPQVGRGNVELGRGWMNPDYVCSEQYTLDRSSAGKRTLEEGLGIFDPSYVGSEKYYTDRQAGAKTQINSGIGIHAPGYQKSLAKEHSERLTKTNLQKWVSTVDGFIGNAGNVAQHNKKNGWDPSARVKLG